MQQTESVIRKKKFLFRFSLILNLFFFSALCVTAFLFRYKIYNKIFPEKKINVVMFGNSLIAYGDWEQLLSRHDIANEGIPGFTTSHFIWSMQKSVVIHKPKICFVEGGINDIAVGIPLMRSIQNIRKIIDTLQLNKITPIIMLTLYTNDEYSQNDLVDSLNILVKNLANEKQVEYIDLNNKLSSNHLLKKEFTIDGTHLTEEAYLIWADEVKKVLAEHHI